MSIEHNLIIRAKTHAELKQKVHQLNAELNGEPSVTSTTVSAPENNELEDEYVDESEISQPATNLQNLATATPENKVDTNDLDSEGIPWDLRIHSSSREKVANGSWRVKRGVDKDLLAKIKAEYRSNLSQAVSTVAPSVHQPSVQAPQMASAPVSTPVVQAAPAMVVPALPTMNTGHTIDSFVANFPLAFGTLITEGKINQEYANSLCAHFGVDQIWKLNDLQKAEVFNAFVQHGIIQKVG